MPFKRKRAPQMVPDYVNLINHTLMDKLTRDIMMEIAVKERFLDPNFSAKELGETLGISQRTLSAVLHLRFNNCFNAVVNYYRVQRALSMMKDKLYVNNTNEELGTLAGFANRQSFYSSFVSQTGKTPANYRRELMAEAKEREKMTKVKKVAQPHARKTAKQPTQSL